MASARPSSSAVGHVSGCRSRDHRWFPGKPDCSPEFGGYFAMDSLASAVPGRPPSGRKPVLHVMPVHTRSGRGAPACVAQAEVAKVPALEMVTGSLAGALFLGLRGVQPVEQPFS